MAPRFVREHLNEGHDRTRFDCGDPALNDWLQVTALSATARGYSRVYVWQVEGVVVAYFTLSSYLIRRENLAGAAARGEWREIPALLLGKFALDRALQGEGLARVLMADAIREAVRAADIAGARYLVVDAVDRPTAEIYQHFGFGVIGDGAGQRLLARLADLRASLPA